jgi:GNAT superfamily N-acetyltransferase
MSIVREHIHQDFLFSTDNKKLDLKYVHHFLTESYWAKGIPLQVVESSIKNSLSIGIYLNENQVGFARVITDYSTFAYLADVFVDEKFRGLGLSKALMNFIFSFEEFKLLRRFILATRDAHGLYAQFGFKPLASPDRFMELAQPDVYKTLR